MSAAEVITGSPAEIGAALWDRFCLPVVRQGSQAAPPEDLAMLYAGFLAAALGSLAGDFGTEFALAIARATTAQLAGLDQGGSMLQ